MNRPAKLIVGLGNPGTQYLGTRHNAGEEFVQRLSGQYGSPLKQEARFYGRTAQIHIEHQSIRLLIPETFMNLSGKAVGAMAHFYRIEPEQILVAHDELDIPPGQVKLKFGGGHGGHNGLRDIISHLANSRNFFRLRLGIGHPGQAKLVSNYVLRRAPANETLLTEQAAERALKVMPHCVKGQWEQAMKDLHTKPQTHNDKVDSPSESG